MQTRSRINAEKWGHDDRNSLANIEAKQMKVAADPDTKYSEISTELQAEEQQPRQLGQTINLVQKFREIDFGRNRNVVAHGILEPCMKEWKQMERVISYHLLNILQTVEIPGQLAIKRVLRFEL